MPAADRKNVHVPEMPRLSWKTTQEAEESLQALYRYAEDRAAEAIGWYLGHKKWKARMSRGLRFAAIVLGTAGGLVPIVQAFRWADGAGEIFGPPLWTGQLGYLFIALAAACVALDRFFGFSTGWMRYITSALTLQRLLSELRMDWAMLVAKLGGAPPPPEQVQAMIQRLREFVLAVDAEVEQETRVWIAEFKSNLAEIERLARVREETARPGAIEVTVPNGLDARDGFTVALDGMRVETVRGTRHQLNFVPPGPHRVTVSGIIAGQPCEASELVTVPPGEVARLTLALPTDAGPLSHGGQGGEGRR